jgi:hypothetical protein
MPNPGVGGFFHAYSTLKPGRGMIAPMGSKRHVIKDDTTNQGKRAGLVRASAQQVIDDDMQGVPPPLVVVAAEEVKGKALRKVEIAKHTHVDLRGSLLRIQNECDPIGFLMDVVNGKAFEQFIVLEDGKVAAELVAPTMRDRVSVARYLASKLMPNLQITKHVMTPSGDEGNADSTGGMTFAQLVKKAAQEADRMAAEGAPAISAEFTEVAGDE